MLRNQMAIAIVCVLGMSGHFGLSADPESKQPPSNVKITLLGMLQEWQYPDSKFGGAEISDAGIKEISSMKCKAILTTTDSAEKILAFYRQKLKVDELGNTLVKQNGQDVKGDRSVAIQDNSIGRALKLYIISVNEKNSSTTLVVSRSETEEATHIAWSHFRQLPQ